MLTLCKSGSHVLSISRFNPQAYHVDIPSGNMGRAQGMIANTQPLDMLHCVHEQPGCVVWVCTLCSPKALSILLILRTNTRYRPMLLQRSARWSPVCFGNALSVMSQRNLKPSLDVVSPENVLLSLHHDETPHLYSATTEIGCVFQYLLLLTFSLFKQLLNATTSHPQMGNWLWSVMLSTV